MDHIQQLKNKVNIATVPCQSLKNVSEIEEQKVIYNEQSLALIEELFVGREDMYTREELNAEGRRHSEYVAEPLTREQIRTHLNGSSTIGTYMVRNNDTVHYVVLDIDVSRKVLCSDDANDRLPRLLAGAAELTADILKILHDMGLNGYAEFSGYRGYHVWIFFSEWLSIRYAYSLLEIITSKIHHSGEEITVEQFPVKNKKKAGSGGLNIKLPYGIHVISGKRSYFLDESMNPITDINVGLSMVSKYSTANIKRVIGSHISDSDMTKPVEITKKVELDYSVLPELAESVAVVLKGCNLMQYLVNKAICTGYLSHLERLSVLHVFGHLGDDGKEFVHTVMGFTMNYQYNITQRFIDRMPGKPVSCIKLREQYKQVTAEYGCSCMFKRTKDCYPSPVIHALKLNTEERHDITIPASRTFSEANKATMYEELNVHVKVQDLAGKIVELKKQKRGIEKSITKVEKDLCRIFDNNNVDCMEVDMGLLVRHKTATGYDWTIEI